MFALLEHRISPCCCFVIVSVFSLLQLNFVKNLDYALSILCDNHLRFTLSHRGRCYLGYRILLDQEEPNLSEYSILYDMLFLLSIFISRIVKNVATSCVYNISMHHINVSGSFVLI